MSWSWGPKAEEAPGPGDCCHGVILTEDCLDCPAPSNPEADNTDTPDMRGE